jgi:two-component system nitrate/nitrite response regulator NarL
LTSRGVRGIVAAATKDRCLASQPLLLRLLGPEPRPALVTTVLVVGEIRLYREGLALILSGAPGFEPIGSAGDVTAAVGVYRRTRPDVVLLDAAVTDTVGAVRALVESEPEMRVVVLGVDEQESEVIAYAEAGVSGYVTRSADTAALCDVLRTVARGGALCSPEVTATLLRRVATLSAERTPPRRTSRLTLREREIVELMRDGLTNKEIAQRLCIEVATVKNHVHNILDKLDVRRRGDVATAIRA